MLGHMFDNVIDVAFRSQECVRSKVYANNKAHLEVRYVIQNALDYDVCTEVYDAVYAALHRTPYTVAAHAAVEEVLACL